MRSSSDTRDKLTFLIFSARAHDIYYDNKHIESHVSVLLFYPKKTPAPIIVIFPIFKYKSLS